MSSDRKQGDYRTTVSMAWVVYEMAKDMMKLKGFNNFSAYVADLIRRDKERDQNSGNVDIEKVADEIMQEGIKAVTSSENQEFGDESTSGKSESSQGEPPNTPKTLRAGPESKTPTASGTERPLRKRKSSGRKS